MFQKRSYRVIIYNSCIYLDEYSYATSIMDFREIQFFVLIDKNILGFNQIYHTGDGSEQENSDNFIYFRDIYDISYFLLSASEKVVSFFKKC